VTKPRIKFPHEFTKNGRTGKVYYLPSTGNFKTHFKFAGKAFQNTFKTLEAAVEFLERDFTKLDTDHRPAKPWRRTDCADRVIWTTPMSGT